MSLFFARPASSGISEKAASPLVFHPILPTGTGARTLPIVSTSRISQDG
jgi:hypothetical protein